MCLPGFRAAYAEETWGLPLLPYPRAQNAPRVFLRVEDVTVYVVFLLSGEKPAEIFLPLALLLLVPSRCFLLPQVLRQALSLVRKDVPASARLFCWGAKILKKQRSGAWHLSRFEEKDAELEVALVLPPSLSGGAPSP